MHLHNSNNIARMQITLSCQILGGIFAGVSMREHLPFEEHNNRVRFEWHR